MSKQVHTGQAEILPISSVSCLTAERGTKTTAGPTIRPLCEPNSHYVLYPFDEMVAYLRERSCRCRMLAASACP